MSEYLPFIYASNLPMYCCCRKWPAWSRDSPAANEGDHSDACSLSEPMDNHSGAQIHLASHGERHAAAGGYMLKENTALGEPSTTRFPTGIASCAEKPTQEQFSCAPGGPTLKLPVQWTVLHRKDSYWSSL